MLVQQENLDESYDEENEEQDDEDEDLLPVDENGNEI